jgi:hypothetical protein
LTALTASANAPSPLTARTCQPQMKKSSPTTPGFPSTWAIKTTPNGGVKRLFFDGIKDGDGICIEFYTKIPTYFVNRVRIEYTLNFEWENHGTVKTREILIYNKEWGSFVYFSA